MTTSIPTVDSVVQSLVTKTRLMRAFEAAREPGGACTIERKDVFLKLFMRSFGRGTAHQIAQGPYPRETIMVKAREQAGQWFESAATPF